MRTAFSLMTMCTIMTVSATTAFAADQNRVLDINVVNKQNVVEYHVKTEKAPTFYAHADAKTGTVFLDVSNAKAPAKGAEKANALVSDSAFVTTTENGQKFARLSLKTNQAVRYDVSAKDKTVVLSIEKDAKRSGIAPRLAQADDDAFDGEGAGGFSTGGTAMTYIGFRNTVSSSRVFARLNDSGAEYDVRREGPNLMVLEIQDASIPLYNNRNHLDASFFDSPVRMITPTEIDGSPPRIRIIIEMKEDVPFTKAKEGNDIVVSFQK